MNTNVKILLDMDGVITNLVTPAMEKMGLPGFRESHFPKGYRFDIVAACNKLRTDAGLWAIPDCDFWDALDYDFWLSLPKYEHADKLMSAAMQMVGEENVFIATSPTLDPVCASAKLEWIKRNMRHMYRRVMVGPRKELMARYNHILVDDADKNVNAFYEAGGMAILVPRPWNSFDLVQDVEYKNTIQRLNYMTVDVPRVLP